MHSFSEWEKLLQIRYTTQSVVCAMVWQLASIHDFPWYAPTYWPFVDATHQQIKQHHTNRGCSYFPAGIILAKIWVEFSIASYPKGRLIEYVTLLNSSLLFNLRLGHSSSSKFWHHNLWSKDHLHWGSAGELLETAPAGDQSANP